MRKGINKENRGSEKREYRSIREGKENQRTFGRKRMREIQLGRGRRENNRR